MAAVTLSAVRKSFGSTEVVHGVDVSIADGEFCVLVGPSGCGKSTLLRMIAGLEEISGGEVRIGERVVNNVAPKQRDIAMVFQNYALYPHMTVYDNMAFSLTLKKVDKGEIERRVNEAASILGLKDFLKRKPKALSGGQRQRVAMGRAIVREPQVFLMDEPLSNLDAKLRVQMRAEIARIQRNLNVTTIYVTHDQVEAMTMGDRVAVMKKGVLQQVDAPQTLYDHPVNIFVAGFIGSPSMNMVLAKLERSEGGFFVTFGGYRLRVDDQVPANRPALERYVDKDIVLGIRPEDMEDASLVPDVPSDRRINATVDLREALGSEVLIHFQVDAPVVVTEDTKELAVDVGAEAVQTLEQRAQEASSTFVAQLNPRTQVREGDKMELFLDTSRLHFFDPETGLGIYDGGSA
jgi:multiple sugar transport system ATP-binding protein